MKLYKKVGSRYKEVGREFIGWPADGVWLVEDGRQSLIMKVGDLIYPEPYAALQRYSMEASSKLRELYEKKKKETSKYHPETGELVSYQTPSYAEVIDCVLLSVCQSREEENTK